jgi:hypothetical protein
VSDCDHGLGVITKSTRPTVQVPDCKKEINNYTYEDLAANRVQMLNLRSAEALSEFVNK